MQQSGGSRLTVGALPEPAVHLLLDGVKEELAHDLSGLGRARPARSAASTTCSSSAARSAAARSLGAVLGAHDLLELGLVPVGVGLGRVPAVAAVAVEVDLGGLAPHRQVVAVLALVALQDREQMVECMGDGG